MSLPRVGGAYVVSRKTRGNSGSVWARARAGSRGAWTAPIAKASETAARDERIITIPRDRGASAIAG